MAHSNDAPARLLTRNLHLLKDMPLTNGVLDLACGQGRNGLFLARNDIAVTFMDKDPSALQQITRILQRENLPGQCRQVDLEQGNTDPLARWQFDAIMVFNYLHRPLMPSLRRAIRPGGLILYETFTVEQARFGRPTNPDFLLRAWELPGHFQGWKVLNYHEGESTQPACATAGLVARKAGVGND